MKEQLKHLVEERISKLSEAIVAELNLEWGEYISYLRSLPKKDRKELKEFFKISSLDDITVDIIAKEISEYKVSIDIGMDASRYDDARRLEYIYGRRTPFSKLISRLLMPNGPTIIMKKHGLL